MFNTMKRILPILPIVVSIFLPLAAHAQQDTIRLTLSDAITTAIQNNRQLAISRLAIDNADAQVKEAYSSTLPSVTLNGRYTRNIQRQVFYLSLPGGDGTVHSIPIGSDNAIATDVTVNQIVYNSAAFSAPNTAQSYARISRQQLRSDAAQTVVDVKRAYFTALFAREALRVNETLLWNAEENMKNAQALYKAGLRAEFDALRAEVQVANQRPAVVQARDNYLAAMDNLKLLLGNAQGREIALVEDLVRPASTSPATVEPSVAEAQTILDTYNAQLQTLKLTADVNEQLIDIRKSDFLPTVSVFGTYQLQAQPDDGQTLSFQPSSFVGLNLSFNIFNGFKTRSQVQEARVQFEQSKLRIAQVEDALKTQLGIVLRRIDYARQRIATGDATINQAQRAYTIATTSYKAGTGTQLQINDADLALAQSKLNQLNAVYDYDVALAELESLLGDHFQFTDDANNNVKYSVR
jgi:outer membrane protein